MDTRQIRQRLRDSLEFQTLCGRSLIGAVIIGIFVIFCGVTQRHDFINSWQVASIIGGIMLAPYLIFAIIRTVRIFAKADRYVFCRTTLSQPHAGPLRDTIYFSALFEDPTDGRKFMVNTHAIFITRGFYPRMDDYANTTVTLAYNRETEMVVVIG